MLILSFFCVCTPFCCRACRHAFDTPKAACGHSVFPIVFLIRVISGEQVPAASASFIPKVRLVFVGHRSEILELGLCATVTGGRTTKNDLRFARWIPHRVRVGSDSDFTGLWLV